jgi:hypothetical protein
MLHATRIVQEDWGETSNRASLFHFADHPGRTVRAPLRWELQLLEACLWAIPDFLAVDAERARIRTPRVSESMELVLSWADEMTRSSFLRCNYRHRHDAGSTLHSIQRGGARRLVAFDRSSSLEWSARLICPVVVPFLLGLVFTLACCFHCWDSSTAALARWKRWPGCSRTGTRSWRVGSITWRLICSSEAGRCGMHSGWESPTRLSSHAWF